MDVLSDFLDASGLRGEIFCQTLAAAPWGLRLPALPQVGLHVVVRGTCWLELDNTSEAPSRLVAGDAVLVPHGTGHSLFDHPDSERFDLERWKASKDASGRLVRQSAGHGAETLLLCGAYRFARGAAHPLVRLLPPLVHVQAGTLDSALDWALRSLIDEITQGRSGSKTMVSRLLDVVFVKVLRRWATDQEDGAAGWLGGADDPTIAGALAKLHGQPQQPWTIETLAREVGVSRPVLARRFRQKVGYPPLTYLTQVRMDLAARELVNTEDNLAAIARRVGYDSEFAFNRAFKREHGMPPGQFRRQHQDDA